MNWHDGTKIEGTDLTSSLPTKKESTSISSTLNALLGDARLTKRLQKCSS